MYLEKNVVRTYNSENDAVHSQITYYGRPDRATHVVIGDSHISRIAAMNMMRYQGFDVAAKGLVLLCASGGMLKMRAVMKQFIRGLYHELQSSFDDNKNTVRIMLALGYNDVDRRTEDFFNAAVEVLTHFKHVLHGVPATWSVHLAELPYGKSKFHHKTVQFNFISNQLNRLLGPFVPLRMWTAQVGVDHPEEDLKPVNCQNVQIMVERCMLDKDDPKSWHNKPRIMDEIRDVVFDWARGVARSIHAYPPNHTYPTLEEFEISVRGRNVAVDVDYFYERQLKMKDAYDHPRDLPMARELSQYPLPNMRLKSLQDTLIPRPHEDEDEFDDDRSSVRDRLGDRQHRGGRGGRGGGRGHGGGRGSGDYHPAPYYKDKKGRRGGRGR